MMTKDGAQEVDSGRRFQLFPQLFPPMPGNTQHPVWPQLGKLTRLCPMWRGCGFSATVEAPSFAAFTTLEWSVQIPHHKAGVQEGWV